LERFAGDYGMHHQGHKVIRSPGHKLKNRKVAVVGSGPAGLCVAGELARVEIKVVIYEALHKPGGVLRYGIPAFRLPQEVLDFEINSLKQLGVEIRCNHVIGKIKSIDELFAQGYSAVFLGLGAGAPSFLNVKGETAPNVYSANEFLTRINLMGADKFPDYHTPVNVGKDIIVIGGGNTAIDAARVALRLQKMSGFDVNTTVFYRRTETEMPARRLEIEHAKQEGVNFEFLVQPTEFISSPDGAVAACTALRCQLGQPDSSGRRRPIPIEGSNFQRECDLAIVAVGLNANRLLTNVTPGLVVDKYGDIEVNKATMQTSIENVYAGGDIVGGEGTVIEAMGMGKQAAKSIIKKILDRRE
jgi:glutamate synthase (NADPH/NADH) small chain